MGGCALITPVYLEIALFSGARSGTQATGQVISAIDIADISIRALREEGDVTAAAIAEPAYNFYPRPPRGGRPSCVVSFELPEIFLSTPSARRATGTYQTYEAKDSISIHALREEGDLRPRITVIQLYAFLSTPSARRATGQALIDRSPSGISIHALREEGDYPSMRKVEKQLYFYPRPPRGGRPISVTGCLSRRHFYPRPPRGGRP